MCTGRTDAHAETPILWPPDPKSWLIGKDPDSGKDWGQEKGVTEDEMVGWHHRLNGHEFKQTPGDIKDREGRHATVHGVLKSQTRLRLNNKGEQGMEVVLWTRTLVMIKVSDLQEIRNSGPFVCVQLLRTHFWKIMRRFVFCFSSSGLGNLELAFLESRADQNYLFRGSCSVI